LVRPIRPTGRRRAGAAMPEVDTIEPPAADNGAPSLPGSHPISLDPTEDRAAAPSYSLIGW
jgi:hypothetical protein